MRVFKAFRTKDASFGAPKGQSPSALAPISAPLLDFKAPLSKDHELKQLITSIEEDVAHSHFRFQQALTKVDQTDETAKQSLSRLSPEMSQLRSDSDQAALYMDRIFHGIQDLTQEPDSLFHCFQQELPKFQQLIADQEARSALAQSFDQTAQGLSGLVEIIASIARQTNLIALQTTIENARAGSNHDLSALAAQIKSLSAEADLAAREMQQRVKALRQETARSVQKTEDIMANTLAAHNSIHTINLALSKNEGAISELAGQAAEIAGFIKKTGAAADRTTAVLMQTKTTFEKTTTSSYTLYEAGIKLHHSLSETIQNHAEDKPRRFERLPADWPARIIQTGLAHKELETNTIDVSEDGVLLQKPKQGYFEVGSRFTVALHSASSMPAEVVAITQLGLHAQFLPCEASQRRHYQSLIEDLQRDYAPLILHAQKLAFEIQTALEKENLQSGVSWFDTAYKTIPGSSVPQYTTSYLTAAEVILPDILDAPLASNDELIFCVVVDRHGYAPVHNRKYAQQPRLDDPYWNTAHCRNKRLFDDATGLAAARSQKPYLLQNYLRDMGGGIHVLMREIDVPLFIHGRHWGALRMGYKI
jgi:methyl-accepting chemotaxis protein